MELCCRGNSVAEPALLLLLSCEQHRWLFVAVTAGIEASEAGLPAGVR